MRRWGGGGGRRTAVHDAPRPCNRVHETDGGVAAPPQPGAEERRWTTRGLLLAEEEVQGPAGADRVEQSLEFGRWGSGGPRASAAPEQVPWGQPAADLAHRHWPRHWVGALAVAARRSGASFPPAPPRRDGYGGGRGRGRAPTA